MIATTHLISASAVSRRLSLTPPVPPAWACALAGPPLGKVATPRQSAVRLRASESPGGTLLEATRIGAAELSDDAFCDAAHDSYALLLDYLAERGRHPVRFWNYLPGIHQPARGGFTRYEVFNHGRWSAYARRLGSRIDGRVPAASAVGHRGRDLVVHALATRSPGQHVENPRQRPAYRYSERYGRTAPAFARATLVRDGGLPWAAISGTASVVGEDSRHAGNLQGQLGETLENLARIAGGVAERAGVEVEQPLDCLRTVRAYVVREGDIGAVRQALEQSLPAAERIEIAAADLCRSELWVEIEGLAVLDPFRPLE